MPRNQEPYCVALVWAPRHIV